ncbi:MAG TPA: hypothetical protein PKH79_08275 [Prolixibacteraceae bacterium]|nr:hypothetical protein [Prolixibacteraceae bacterium]HPS12951.1 hypothetical protein [Prolixibacteraceae bacterium]
MSKYLFNPFRYIAGWESLAAGVIALLATSVIAYFSHIHFPDLISVKTNPGIPYYVLLFENTINWLVPSILLYLSALIFSQSSVRVIDIFGTQALARAPYLIAALTGISGTIDKFGKYTLWKTVNVGDPVVMSTGEIMLAITLLLFMVLATIWMIALMYNAFKVSANIKGPKLIIPFIVVMVLSTAITGFATYHLFGNLFPMPVEIPKP